MRERSIQNLANVLRQWIGKIIIALTIFAKHSILNLWEGSEYVSSFKHVRVLNIPGMSICQGSGFLVLYRLTYFYKYVWGLSIPGLPLCPGFWISRVTHQSFIEFWTWFGSKYARAQNMASLWICKSYTGLWICLEIPEYALMPQHAGMCLNNAEYAEHCQTFKMERFAKK